MKIGICSDISRIATVRDMGYDYIECSSAGLAAKTDAEFKEAVRSARDSGLPVMSTNGLFPWTPEYRFFSETATNDFLLDYLKRIFEREGELGVSSAVFGSGGSRRFPENVSYPDACRRLVEVMRMAGDCAAPYGITVVFEPLRPAETNIGNSLCEGALLVQMADHPNVGLLADYYHMAVAGEPMSELCRIGGVRHAHIATREGRHAPLVAGSDDFLGFFRGLKKLGTCDGVSIESGWADFGRDAPRALAFLRGIAAQADAE